MQFRNVEFSSVACDTKQQRVRVSTRAVACHIEVALVHCRRRRRPSSNPQVCQDWGVVVVKTHCEVMNGSHSRSVTKILTAYWSKKTYFRPGVLIKIGLLSLQNFFLYI